MLALDGTELFHLNRAAAALFPRLKPGSSVLGTLPDYLLFDLAEQAASSAVFAEREFIVAAKCFDRFRLLSFSPVRQPDSSFVSDGLLNELRSGLLNVSLSARQIGRGGTPEELRRGFALLWHSYFQLARQISNLGTATQLREKTIPLRPRRGDLAAFCRELVDALNGFGASELAQLTFSSPLATLNACFDPELVERLLLNLLSNSFQHCPPGSSVCLRLDKKSDRVILSVDDDGSGIPADVLQNVFSRYENRLRPELLSQPLSSGLGLAIARGIAELHGGALIIESKPGRGTSVRVMLPLEQAGAVILEDAPGALADFRFDLLRTELSCVLRADRYESVQDEM
jgi:signal transduction histidine kinase